MADDTHATSLAQAARTTRYVVTVDNITGLVLKVDKLEDNTTKEAATMTPPVDPAALAAFAAPTSDQAAVVQAYFRGIADYLNALMTVK